MSFRVRVSAPPAGSVGWEGRWVVDGVPIGWLDFVDNTAYGEFTGDVHYQGVLYFRFAAVYPEEGEEWITGLIPAGSMNPAVGSVWVYDYYAQRLYEETVVTPAVRNLQVAYARV